MSVYSPLLFAMIASSGSDPLLRRDRCHKALVDLHVPLGPVILRVPLRRFGAVGHAVQELVDLLKAQR